ncbi:hypothetical protein Q5752_004078 [Cryptotrichosporon argae]
MATRKSSSPLSSASPSPAPSLVRLPHADALDLLIATVAHVDADAAADADDVGDASSPTTSTIPLTDSDVSESELSDPEDEEDAEAEALPAPAQGEVRVAKDEVKDDGEDADEDEMADAADGVLIKEAEAADRAVKDEDELTSILSSPSLSPPPSEARAELPPSSPPAEADDQDGDADLHPADEINEDEETAGEADADADAVDAGEGDADGEGEGDVTMRAEADEPVGGVEADAEPTLANDDEHAGDEDADLAEEPDAADSPATLPHRPQHSSHLPPPTPGAVRALLSLEIKFAQLRDRLYAERVEEAAREEQMVLDGTHPALIYLNKTLAARREHLHEVAARRHAETLAELARSRDSDKKLVWSSWTDERDRLHYDAFDQTWRKRRRLAREKNEIETLRITKPIPRPDRPPRAFDWSSGVPAKLTSDEAMHDLQLMEIRRPAPVASRHASPAVYPSYQYYQSQTTHHAPTAAQTYAHEDKRQQQHHHHHHHHHHYSRPGATASAAAPVSASAQYQTTAQVHPQAQSLLSGGGAGTYGPPIQSSVLGLQTRPGPDLQRTGSGSSAASGTAMAAQRSGSRPLGSDVFGAKREGREVVGREAVIGANSGYGLAASSGAAGGTGSANQVVSGYGPAIASWSSSAAASSAAAAASGTVTNGSAPVSVNAPTAAYAFPTPAQSPSRTAAAVAPPVTNAPHASAAHAPAASLWAQTAGRPAAPTYAGVAGAPVAGAQVAGAKVANGAVSPAALPAGAAPDAIPVTHAANAGTEERPGVTGLVIASPAPVASLVSPPLANAAPPLAAAPSASPLSAARPVPTIAQSLTGAAPALVTPKHVDAVDMAPVRIPGLAEYLSGAQAKLAAPAPPAPVPANGDCASSAAAPARPDVHAMHIHAHAPPTPALVPGADAGLEPVHVQVNGGLAAAAEEAKLAAAPPAPLSGAADRNGAPHEAARDKLGPAAAAAALNGLSPTKFGVVAHALPQAQQTVGVPRAA